MKRVHSIDRNQPGNGVGAFAMVLTVFLMPCTIAAEDTKQRTAAQTNATPSAKTETKSAVDAASPEKLIVGTWRGGNHSGKVTLNADGTYREFPSDLSMTEPNVPVAENMHGTWLLDRHELLLSWQVDQAVALPTGAFQEVKAEMHRRYKVARLDGSFLRLTALDDAGNENGTQFYRRLGDVTPLVHLKGKVSDEVLHVAELAHMDSEEALLLAAWTKNDARMTAWLAMVARGLSAAHGKSGLQELFGFSDDEFKAASELKKLIGVGMLSPDSLRSQGLLAPEEESALKKIGAVQDQLRTVYTAISVPPRASGNDDGAQFVAGLRAENENADDPVQARLRMETVTKLKGVLDEFQSWLSGEAFANPAPPGAMPPAGGQPAAGLPGGFFPPAVPARRMPGPGVR